MKRCIFQVAVAMGVIIATAAIRTDGPAPAPRTLDATSPITYFIADGARQTGFQPPDRQLAKWAFEAWERSSGKRFRFEAAAESSAVIRLYWAESNEGQYGEMRPLTVGGRRGAAVYIRPDVDSLGEDIARRARVDPLLRDSIVYLTCLHELGHALGLMHTSDFRDIMYFFGFGGDIVDFRAVSQTAALQERHRRGRRTVGCRRQTSKGDVRASIGPAAGPKFGLHLPEVGQVRLRVAENLEDSLSICRCKRRVLRARVLPGEHIVQTPIDAIEDGRRQAVE